MYIYIYVYSYIFVIQGKSNQHFNEIISGTAFISSCEHLKFISSA